ncbi:NTP transferase domain-containing protein [Sphingomonas donggukensis]|uniref:NTP transferase domain-containing protein n=1 Tax=Sphingomonas donggukensis TaxID=2949093 RepID=A0ABY4TS92_9SPHN|nr:NTP transferase domain-containing protein [Sphingomonas donggukensis]URW74596.1 NTP transferase domain-containing protein [Sphingomonas donggukensis]
MHCLIIAAGFGSRLRDISPSKPLTPVGGRPLIAQVIARAAAGGASRFTVVTGYEGDRVEAFLRDLAADTGISIDTVRVADWSLPNGHSVLAGAESITGDFLLTMADHLIDPAMVAGLIARGSDGAGLVLAIDRDLANPLVDLDDVMKVSTAPDGAILAIGKDIATYDAFDTGLFLVTPALIDAIRAAVAGGAAGSLSDGVQALARAGRAMTHDVTGYGWIDVDDPAALAKAEAWLAA